MSAELEFIDGRAQVLTKDHAWHHLSEVQGEAFGLDEITEQAPAILLPVRKVTPVILTDTGVQELPKTSAVVRADNKIVGEGVGRESYGLVQPLDALAFGEAYANLDDNVKPLISAGTLREGSQFFFTYDVGKSDVNGEILQRYASILSSHDASIPLQLVYSTIVVVCANTADYVGATGEKRVVLKHTSKVEDRIKAATRAQVLVNTRVARENEIIAALQAKGLNTREFDLVLDGVLPSIDEEGRSKTQRDNARAAIRELTRSPLTTGFEKTAWAAVQAFNSYEQWIAPVRKPKGFTGTERDLRALRQFDAVAGSGQPLTTKALKVLATVN